MEDKLQSAPETKKAAPKAATKPKRRAKAAALAVARTGGEQAVRERPAGKRAALPDFVPLSLAALYDKPPSGPEWLHEIKFDGYRMEARLDHGKVRLLTRREQDWTHRFKPVAAAVAALPAESALLDGEVVVEDERGVSSFSLLQTDLKDGRDDRFVYYVFDLLSLDGRDFSREPLIERKAALARLLRAGGGTGVIRFTDHFNERGSLILDKACEMGLEGIISKRRNAPYRSGRSDNFVKSKCRGGQELIVAGYVAGDGHAERHRRPYRGGKRERRAALRRPGRHRLHPEDGARSVQAVAAAAHRKAADHVTGGRTAQGRRLGEAGARHRGRVRGDDSRRDIAAGFVQGHPRRQGRSRGRARGARTDEKFGEGPGPGPVQEFAAGARGQEQECAAAPKVRLTHPDRVYWADVGVTKKDLADYYVSVWDWMKPHLVGRALAIVRCPDGTAASASFRSTSPRT